MVADMELNAERPALTAEQRLELNYIKLTWDRFYEITCDGTTWFATPRGTDDVIEAGSKEELGRLLMLYAPSRSSGGHFIEGASGPPFWVDDRDRPARSSRAC
jgi:hypothetical protein